MKQAIVYSSKTGNTKMLADMIHSYISTEELCYIGEVNEIALQADRIFIGFWTDKGTCSEELLPFLQQLHQKQVFLFGTAGFGGDQSYFDTILNNVLSKLSNDNTLIGTFMCQGKMPASVRVRYEAMAKTNDKMSSMIENFDKASHHPNDQDIQDLRNIIEIL